MATQKQNKRTTTKLYLTAIVSFVVLAAVCTVPAAPPEGKGGGSWPIYSLRYLEPLYVAQDGDLAYLTTFDPLGTDDADVAELVELVDPTTGESHKGNSKPVVGTYSMPFQVILRRVYIP